MGCWARHRTCMHIGEPPSSNGAARHRDCTPPPHPSHTHTHRAAGRGGGAHACAHLAVRLHALRVVPQRGLRLHTTAWRGMHGVTGRTAQHHCCCVWDARILLLRASGLRSLPHHAARAVGLLGPPHPPPPQHVKCSPTATVPCTHFYVSQHPAGRPYRTCALGVGYACLVPLLMRSQ